jgi:hypothetical protein
MRRSKIMPRVRPRCVANTYAAADQRIIEFSFPGARLDGHALGGLISFWQLPGGRCRVEIYGVDPGVEIIAPKADRNRRVKKARAS